MRSKMWRLGLGLALGFALQAAADTPRQMIAAAGVKGGVLAVAGCGDGEWLRPFGTNAMFHVVGLHTNAEHVAALRSQLRREGFDGRTLVDEWDGRQLPFIDNFVNALVLEPKTAVSRDEALRVLVPNGTAIFLGSTPDERPATLIKPRSPLMDDWTHWDYSAAHDPCSHDELVGPPRRMQWYTRPFWTKYHFSSPAVHFILTGKGRVFYDADESPSSTIGGGFPEKWALIARDAFNGQVLWRRSLPAWGMAMYDHDSFLQGKVLNLPRQDRNQRRFAVDGDRLFGVLSYNGPVVAMDAASGRVERTFPGTEAATDVLVHNRRLYVLSDSTPAVQAFDPDTGAVVWSSERMHASAMALDGNQLCVLDGEGIHAFDAATYKPLWTSSSTPARDFLLHAGKVVLGHATDNRWLAYSAQDGHELWSFPIPKQTRKQGLQTSFRQIFATPDRVWMFKTEFDLVGLDPLSGAAEIIGGGSNVFYASHHHRCFKDRATDRFFICGQEGIEFASLTNGTNAVDNWTRGTCNTGVTPANGLLYVPPSSCACVAHAMLHGLYAFAPAGAEPGRSFTDDERLAQGPAFGTLKGRPAAATDWPIYRGDAERRSATASAVPGDLRTQWTTRLGGALTPPTIAEGRVFVADKTDHTVRALDARTGAPLWTFCAGGAVDGPPSVWGDAVIFGCADGRVYCLRAGDGALAWRFQAAPRDSRNMQVEEITSVWPVHGSVLIKDGRVTFAAGHSSRLDGGIRVYALDALSGATLAEHVLHDESPAVPAPTNQRPNDREGVRADLMVSDGDQVFMQHVAFDKTLAATNHVLVSGTVGIHEDKGITSERHVYNSAGFLDDSWNHRMVWTYGGIHAEILSVDAKSVYGLKAYDESGFQERYQPGLGYVLFAQSIDRPGGTVVGGKDLSRTDLFPHPLTTYTWWLRVPVRAQSLVRAGDRLIAAGQPDVVVKGDPFAAFEGRAGGKLWVLSPGDGKKTAELDIPSPPVYDGVAAAEGALFISAMDGSVVALGAGKQR